jgi:putative methionine-R-sulfoxide reductase with GAF domain
MRTEITALIRAVVESSSSRVEKAEEIAGFIRRAGNYRWVGVYDVGPDTVSIIAYSGPGVPAYPQFPVTRGLTAAAVREKKTVVVGDVRNDPRYLTAFGSTLSEMIVPVLEHEAGVAIGTIDVESERTNAFSSDDQRMLEACARAARPLWDGD